MTSAKEVIEGAIYDSLSDWRSGYHIHEDLPYIAEWITEFVLKSLADFDYIIKKESD